MAQTLQTLSPLLKEMYESGVKDLLNNETAAWNRIQSTSAGTTSTAGGKYVTFSMHVKRNNGIGSRNEMETLPTPGRQGYARAFIPMRYHYASVGITGQAIELANTDAQAFASAQKEEITRIKNDISKERNRQFFGDGLGTRGVVSGAPTGTTVPVVATNQLDDGGRYDIMVGATADVRVANVIASSVDYDDDTITFDGATLTGVEEGDIIVRHKSYDREIHGLGAVLSDTTTLYGVDPAVVSQWKAKINDNGGTSTAISELMMTRMVDRLKKDGNKPTVIWTTPGVLRAYWSLLSGQRRYVNTKDYAGGYSGLSFQTPSSGEIPMLTDSDVAPGSMYFLDEKDIKFYQLHDYKFMDRTGSMWSQVRDAEGRYDAYEATMSNYSEMGVHNRGAHGLITNITEDQD